MQHLKLDRLYYRLSELPELLSISRNELIEQGIQGNLEFFVRVPPNAKVWSVHRDAIDIDSPTQQYRKITGQSKPINANETHPVSMESHEIAGLVLSKSDCFRLRGEGILLGSIFDYAVNSRANWVCEVAPLARNGLYGVFNKDICHDLEGWKLALYPTSTPLKFLEGIGYPRPLEIDITVENVWVTQRSLDRFLHSINNGLIVDEFFEREENGAFVGIKEEAIHSISDRLRYLLDVVNLCWGSYRSGESPEEIKTRQEAVNNQLKNKEFTELFDNDEVSAGLLESLSNFTTPVFTIRQASELDRKTYPTFVTPQIVSLVVAWKIHWSGDHIDADNPNTHPPRSGVVKYMRGLGFSGNEPAFAATILRPSTASKGRPVPEKRWKRPEIRKHTI